MIAAFSAASLLAVIPHVAPGIVDRVIDRLTVLCIALTVLVGAAVILTAPIVGVTLLTVVVAYVLAFESTAVSPYGRSSEPTTPAYRSPDSVALAPHPIASPIPSTWRDAEIARLCLAFAKAKASRHQSRARAYATRIVTLRAIALGSVAA